MYRIALLVGLILLSSLAYFQGVPVRAQLSANLAAPAVVGGVDLNHPGTDTFWSKVNSVQVPLTSTSNYGGNTKSVTLKMATNGTDLLVLATWADPTQSRIKNNVIEDPSYPALFKANSTFYYEDRIAIWWSLDQNAGPPPCMQKSAYGHGEGESLAGTGNIWHWKAARTDSLGSSFGKLKYGSGPHIGQALIPPYSYADNEYINGTGHMQLGWDQYPTASVPGNFTIGYGENFVPYNTFEVAAHGVYNGTTHTWSWVAARSLTTQPKLHQVQFKPGQVYYFALGIWDGGPIPMPAVPHPAGWTAIGENEETKSISSWYTMEIPSTSLVVTTTSATTASVTATQNQAAGIPFETAAVVSLGTLVVGFAVGLIVIRRVAVPNEAPPKQ
jgi:hypothetical protein